MNWFYQEKKRFLIRLLKALGFGSVIAYCICSCDSKPVSQDVKQSEPQVATEPNKEDVKQSDPQVAPEANKEIEFQIEVTPPDTEIYILENNTETLFSSHSPCTYRFDTAKNSVGLKFSAPDYESDYRVITKDTPQQIKIDLKLRPKAIPHKYLARRPDKPISKSLNTMPII